MARSFALLLLLLPACAGTQSVAAFIPRSAAPDDPVTYAPDHAGDHDRALADCLERSLEAQEKADRVDPALAEPPSEATELSRGTTREPQRSSQVAAAR